ncbi:MAG: hypothetical protein HW405_87 [Candidatus Berkelbacteria bacterium]|nr:hypothetical protein [Candidatus Berkelbacteria bacterium]
MTKENSSKTIWTIIAVVSGVLIIGGLIFGFGLYNLYKAGTAVVVSPSSSIAETKDLRPYANVRYGFWFNYPKAFSATESQNGDGVTLITDDPPMTIRAYGSNNVLSQNLDEYLNWVRDNLFKETENAEEILAEETTLGGIPAQERQWTYKNSIDGSQTLVDQVTAFRDDVFYIIHMTVGYSDFDEYPAHVLDQIITSFKF